MISFERSCDVTGGDESMVVDSVKTEAVAEEGSRERDLPKALVKPQVLTHVIEGYVIQEGECQSG